MVSAVLGLCFTFTIWVWLDALNLVAVVSVKPYCSKHNLISWNYGRSINLSSYPICFWRLVIYLGIEGSGEGKFERRSSHKYSNYSRATFTYVGYVVYVCMDTYVYEVSSSSKFPDIGRINKSKTVISIVISLLLFHEIISK